METRRGDLSECILMISPCNSFQSIRFTFPNGANFTYSLQLLANNCEYIEKTICKTGHKISLNLTELGWQNRVPYLLLFLEYIGGSHQYPLNMAFRLYFLKFSEFFVLQRQLSQAENAVIAGLSLKEIHLEHRNLWTFREFSIGILEKIVNYSIYMRIDCIDIMRAYLDWIDEKSYSDENQVIRSNPFLMVQKLIKLQGFYKIDYKNKKEALVIVCNEYRVAYQVFDMHEMMVNGWV